MSTQYGVFLLFSFTLLDLTLISPPQFSWSHLY
jgi:hypothetical protein